MTRKRTGKGKGSSLHDERVDEIAAQLDDVGTMIDEIAADPNAPGTREKLKDARQTVDSAVDTIDDIADKEPRRPRR